jgi:hypothetical protein
MAASDPQFRSFHALRIKGFAKSDVVAEIAGLALAEVEEHLVALQAAEHALFREARALWQLTPAGKEAHRGELAKDAPEAVRAAIEATYPTFLDLNVEFKSLCGDWQLVDGDASRVNDHSDSAYDSRIIARLLDFDDRARPVVSAFASAHERMSPYSPRLMGSLDRLRAGDTKMFTGVMCNSYHDVWMELHEDLILTLGIDRAAEGSF